LAAGAGHAVIDITGVPTVPTVDTEIAQHLLKTVSAAPRLGAQAHGQSCLATLGNGAPCQHRQADYPFGRL
jgi:hypothetical protein